MKHLLLCLCLFTVAAAYSQNGLKMEVTAAGDTLYSTGDKKIYSSPGAKNAIAEVLKASLYKSASRYMLCLQIETGRTSVFTIDSNQPAEITFTDGSTLALYSRSDNSSRRSVLNYGCYMFVFYTIKSDALSQLQATGIKTIAIHSSAGKMTYDIKEKNSDELRKLAAKCK